MQIINVPINVLLHLRIPDRDIHRYIVLNRNVTPNELVNRFNLDRNTIDNSLNRLARLGLIKCKSIAGRRFKRGQSRTSWYPINNPVSNCIIDPKTKRTKVA